MYVWITHQVLAVKHLSPSNKVTVTVEHQFININSKFQNKSTINSIEAVKNSQQRIFNKSSKEFSTNAMKNSQQEQYQISLQN